MHLLLESVLRDRELARHLAAHGRRTILERHTCGHRVEELLAIAAALGVRAEAPARPIFESVS